MLLGVEEEEWRVQGLIADKLGKLASYTELDIRTDRAVTCGQDTEGCMIIAGREGSAEGDGHGGWCAGK